ncbi:centrosome and spindle pole-associated protein 1 isoform X3 [Mastacembelus armatus]|uniref:centrosome and spindle pole-associated protein 1 isoform X3 n=1 Tax=Mastacembelus armatus TaxID=205130 RepID=UPI000E455351|nr:centrosome and spindle pole-associated protein 1 isoform X3 [Mastacembelus armatus]
MPPASASQGVVTNKDRDLGISFLLGADYERKKQKLQQELQLDYKHYIAKKKDPKTKEAHPQPQGLSLPIDEKLSVREKLREERNKEYNLFLQDQGQIRRFKRGAPPVTSKPGQVQDSDGVYISSPASPLSFLNTHTNTPPPHRERPHRRDAATLTETVDNGKSTETWEPDDQRQRRLHRPKEPNRFEEELFPQDEEMELRHRRRKDRHTLELEGSEERKTKKHHKDSLQMPECMKATKSRPTTGKNKAEFATGLIIGAAEEQKVSQMKKEQYKQELLKQIEEQQRNKIREKKFELRVAATGAMDPEKEPDRIKQFGVVNRQSDSWRRDITYKPGIDLKTENIESNPRPKDSKPIEDTEHRSSSGKCQVDYSTALSQLTDNMVSGSGMGSAQGVSLLDYFNEDYHRDFSNMLGEVAIQRVAGVPPPAPPNLTNNYKTPFDAAYYYYGSRHPLHHNLPHYKNDLPAEAQQSGNSHSPPQRPLAPRCSGPTEYTGQHRASPLGDGQSPADRSKQRRESTLSYREALKQQIKEREERKRREKEEKEQYDAKIEAEMMAYNPWGKSGGGAPIKDQKGNLFSDLNQMHRINEESYKNEHTQNILMTNGHTLGDKGFNDQPTPKIQRYREALKQQIDENKSKQAEERQRMRIEEEKEEKRLAEQRARIQQTYEEEQRKQKKTEQRMENQSWIHEPKAYGNTREEEKSLRQEQTIEKKIPESGMDREENKIELSYKREPSPPIPTLQKKQKNLVASRPSSPVSQLSSRTVHSVSAPHYRPVSVKIPTLQDGHQGVIRELSALRRYLRKEQKQMEAQLGQIDLQESHYTPSIRHRGRPRVNAFESAHKKADQLSDGRPYSGSVNMKNIREFNQLKYRDTASREEVLHMHPDPPTDAQSLDIQQQALLREQQRKIRLMKREEEHDILDQHLYHDYPNKPGRLISRGSILPSETAFIDVYSGDAQEEQAHQQKHPQPSAKDQERAALQRSHDYDEVAVPLNEKEHDIHQEAQSLQSSVSLNGGAKFKAHNLHSIRKQDLHTGEHNSRSEGLSSNEVDVLSLRSALDGHVSVETIATEPWLRPGTSDAVKHSGCRRRPNSSMDAPPWLTQQVT